MFRDINVQKTEEWLERFHVPLSGKERGQGVRSSLNPLPPT